MNCYKTVSIIFGLLFCPALLCAQIVLSEIMFNAPGNERYNEFIELYNPSSQKAVNLNGWLVSDGEKYNVILPCSDSTILRPRQYAVILVPNYFEKSNEYEKNIPDSALILTINKSQFGAYGLANEKQETVSILTQDTTTVASWEYHVPNPDGISEEKILPGQGDVNTNWGHSLVTGGTPGYKNSITPEEFDIALDKDSFTMEPENPGYGQTGLISITVKNAGMISLNDVSVVCSYQTTDSDLYHVIDDTIKIVFIEAFDIIQVHFSWQNIPSGVHNINIGVVHPLDQQPDNNFFMCEIIAGYPDRALVLNEIMYNPLPNMAEWTEIYNPGPLPVNLKNWSFSDEDTVNAVVLCDSSVFIQPTEFIVMAQDPSIHDQIDPGTIVFINKDFPSLNNEADGVILFDGAHKMIEQISYQQSWGGAKGKSLERINPGITGNSKNNWGTSVNVSGHTAGYLNSIFTTVIPENTSITVSPDPFSPDGDGFDDLTAITYTLHASTAYINIRIFDILGRQVRFLKNNEPGASKGTIFWDGLNDEGMTCRMGIYIVLIEVQDTEHKAVDRAQTTVVLAQRL